MMLKEEAVTIQHLEDELQKSLTIIPQKDIHMEKYEIIWESEPKAAAPDLDEVKVKTQSGG